MPLSTFLEKDFIGRRRETEALYNISSESRKGIATSIFLSGQRGIGKSGLLRQLSHMLFWNQREVVPFYYSVNPAFTSVYDFSVDYLNRFIRQWIAFQKKDASLVRAAEHSVENLMQLAHKADVQWAVDLIGNFLQTKTSHDTTNLFLSAINAPLRSYIGTGIPVVVIIDDFQRIKDLYIPGAENNKNLWMLFEEPARSRHTPHILAGAKAELDEMFFLRTSFGEFLEIFNLSGLDKNASSELFTLLCKNYGVSVDKESLFPFIDLFNGNPFYIRNLIMAARHEGSSLSVNDLWQVYFNEIISGKFHIYWVSRLRMYMPQLELRKVSLEILHYISSHKTTITPSNLAGIFSITTKELYEIINLFQRAGIIETHFSVFRLIDDSVLTDIIKALYSREILEKPLSAIEEEIMAETHKKELFTGEKISTPSLFEITIPVIPRAELIAVNALKQVASVHNISPENAGQLQVALIDLFTYLMPEKDKSNSGNFYLRFEPGRDVFIIEIKAPYTGFISAAASEAILGNQFLKKYIDDIKLEETRSGTKITMRKNLKKTPSTGL